MSWLRAAMHATFGPTLIVVPILLVSLSHGRMMVRIQSDIPLAEVRPILGFALFGLAAGLTATGMLLDWRKPSR